MNDHAHSGEHDGAPVVLLITNGSFSHINEQIEREIKLAFPDCRIVRVDPSTHRNVSRLHIGNFVNLGYTLFAHSWLLMTRRRTRSECMSLSRFRMWQLRRWFLKFTKPWQESCLFTLSTQMLFDAHIAGIRHYLYVDHTHLVNLTYPGFDTRRIMKSYVKSEERIFGHARRVFVMSANVQRSLESDYGIPSDRVVLAGAGANAPLIPVNTDVTRYASGRILFVGIDWERKGASHLIEAFGEIAEEFPNATLRMVGREGKDWPGHVIGIGRLTLAQVSQEMADAAIFCFPTQCEPFGIVILEAMQLGLPIITTDIGALPELVDAGQSGILVPPGNVEALAAALRLLLASPGFSWAVQSVWRAWSNPRVRPLYLAQDCQCHHACNTTRSPGQRAIYGATG